MTSLRVLGALMLALVSSPARADEPDETDDIVDTDVELVDADGDGIPDALDPSPFRCDGDFDGIVDPVEMGWTAPWPGLEGAPCFRADADPSTTTDPSDPDTDRGGRSDGAEDRNRNGRIDRWEVDPSDPSDDVDTDGDGIPDAVEGVDDPDGDGVPNARDLDSDGDGREDRIENYWDVDEDGIPAFLDLDSDGDGLPDAFEPGDDLDRDGRSAWNDPDADGDGVEDGIDGVDDIDGDDRPGYLDVDQDGDGLRDGDEFGRDDDCDGVPDHRDRDNFDGFCVAPPEGAIDGAPWDRPFDPLTPVDPDAVREVVGCAVAPAGAGWLALFGLLGLWRRRP